MEAARRLFTTMSPPATLPAAEETLKRNQHPGEVGLRAVSCHSVVFSLAIPEISEKGKPALLAATGR